MSAAPSVTLCTRRGTVVPSDRWPTSLVPISSAPLSVAPLGRVATSSEPSRCRLLNPAPLRLAPNSETEPRLAPFRLLPFRLLPFRLLPFTCTSPSRRAANPSSPSYPPQLTLSRQHQTQCCFMVDLPRGPKSRGGQAWKGSGRLARCPLVEGA